MGRRGLEKEKKVTILKRRLERRTQIAMKWECGYGRRIRNLIERKSWFVRSFVHFICC